MRAALTSTVAAILLAATAVAGEARAQAAPDIAGHWEGMATGVIGVQGIALDIARNPDRSLKVAISTDDVHGAPVVGVRQSGDRLSFDLPGLHASFDGELEPSGKVMTGMFTTPLGEAGVSFTRDGDAEFVAAPVNSRIDPRLEGAWEGVLEAEGHSLHARLTLANGASGASGVFSSVDEGLDIPVAIKEAGGRFSVALPMVGGVFEGALSPAGDALTGTYSQRGQSFALVLTRPKN